MKVLYLFQYFKFPEEQGSTRAYDLAQAFIKFGYDVTMVSATSDEKYNNDKRWNVIEKNGLKVHYIYIPYDNHFNYLKRISAFIRFVCYSSFRLLNISTDVVLATSTPLTIGIPALIKKYVHNTPFIFEVRDVWPEVVIAIGAIRNFILKNVLYKIEKTIYKHASFIIPLSVDMKASIDRRLPEFKEKTSIVIPNIAEINRFQNSRLNKTVIQDRLGFKPRFTVLYAGTFGKVNGIHKIVDLAALTKQRDSDLVYVLIGSGAEKSNVREKAKMDNVLDKNLFIFDPVAKRELPDWYASASMGSSFVIDIPELWSNSANKFFDTLAAAKPALINHKGWQAEVIHENNIGFVLPQLITEAAAEEFVEYTCDIELHFTQCQNALALAKGQYSLEIAKEKYLRVFSEIKIG